MPVISVIVPTFRRVPELARCLAALGRQARPADQIVVVCRDTDTDSHAAVAASGKAIDLALVGTGGQVAAMNTGLDAARGEIVAIIDDDTIPSPDWLERIERHYANDARLGGLGGRDVVHHGERVVPASEAKVGIIELHGRIIGNHHIGLGAAREVHVLKGANLSFRVAALAGARFDSRLLGAGAQVCNEVGICAAVRRNGWRVVYDPAIVVDHFPAVRHDEDARNTFSPVAQHNATHNETLAVLDASSLAPAALSGVGFRSGYAGIAGPAAGAATGRAGRPKRRGARACQPVRPMGGCEDLVAHERRQEMMSRRAAVHMRYADRSRRMRRGAPRAMVLSAAEAKRFAGAQVLAMMDVVGSMIA